jgi:putative copper export protein
VDDSLTVGLLAASGRAFEFGAILLYLGATTERLIGERSGGSTNNGVAARRRRLVGVVVGVLFAGLLLELVAQSANAFGWAEGLRLESLRLVGIESRWGTAWLRRLGVAMLAAVAVVVPQRYRMSAGVAVLLALTTAASGHALSETASALWPVTLLFIHVVGAGVWLGTLAVTSWIYDPRVTDSTVQTGALERFSRVARFAGPAAFLAGIITAVLYLDSWGELLTTSYGRVLLLKVSALATAAGFGAYHWLVALPKVRRDPTHLSKLRESVGLELAFGTVAVVLTAVLVGLPMS